MKRYRYRTIGVLASLALASAFLATATFAQNDPNPNSSTPILIGSANPVRALAARESANRSRSSYPPKASELGESFDTGARVIFFVKNVQLMQGEGKNAFRFYAEDARRRLYRFPILDLQLVDQQNGIYAIKIELRDELKFAEVQPAGDLVVSVTWRGLESNRLLLTMGPDGDKIAMTDARLQPSANSAAPPQANDLANVGYVYSADRKRFMEQAGFGPSHSLDLRIRRIGLRGWLAEQFEMQYPSAGNPYPNFPLRPTTLPVDCNGQVDDDLPDPDPFCYANHYTMYPVQNWFYKEAFYGDAQLRHKTAWALSQIWVISGVDIQQSRHMVAYHKVLSRNAFGNWRTLMKDMTLNAGMGDYLDVRESTAIYKNENFAREVLQLFNIGLVMLNPDGTVQTDSEGTPIPTYDQRMVNNFTTLFTGWNLCEASLSQCPNRSPGSPNFIDPMIITNPANHDLSAKTLFSYPGSTTTNVPACVGCTGAAVIEYANNSLNQALDNIYNHPNVAPFVSRFLIQQFVTGDPTPAYVGRISAVFNANRTNPTQLKEVIKAILLDPEARGDSKTDPRYGKLREPVMLLTNLARLFDARSADRTTLSDGVLTSATSPMGQIAFMPTSVFNYYPPGYIVPGSSFNGPEFSLYTTGSAIARINFVNTLVFNGIPINAEARITQGTSIGLNDLAAIAAADTSCNDLMNVLDIKMMHGTMSPQMRSTILNVVLSVPDWAPVLRAKRAVYLVATSSQYQVQR
ncbi:MAG TPA: DUF1800 family protein [Pyrinomonadaceae bacterium]|nr:DUF1800 family protein [Pyrinomonadaceae bacterium]